MPVFTKSARFWTIAFGIWFIVLNILSHGSHLHAPHGWAFDIPHIDKIAHFGYFFGGAGLLSVFPSFPFLASGTEMPNCAPPPLRH